MGYPWDDDDPLVKTLVGQNLAKLVPLVKAGAEAREDLSLNLVREWHLATLNGVTLVEPDVAGNFRGEGTGRLLTYPVQVNGIAGLEPAAVASALVQFEQEMHQRIETIDAALPTITYPPPTELEPVLRLCAELHGEWVRIHPFADGNGRTARLWAQWCAFRYGLPHFIGLRPRPKWKGKQYEWAAQISMVRGDHRLMRLCLTDWLTAYNAGSGP